MIERTLFNYTTGNILELNGENYIGYYNVTNGNFYSGREVTPRSSFLTVSDNALGNYYKEKLYFNRIPTETLKLPYSKSDIKFEPSDFINQNSINEKLKKLNSNYLELFNYTSSQTNDLPEGFVGFIGASGTNADSFGLNTFDHTGYYSLSNIATGLNNIRRFEVIPRKLSPTETNPSSFLSIYATKTAIYAFNCPNTNVNTTFTFRSSSSFVDGFNTRPYSYIADITTNGKDILYISDINHNQIYRVYIDPLVNDSRITGNDLEYLNQGGVEINTVGNGILSGAEIIEYGLGELYTYNSGTKSFVVLGKDLSFKRKFTNKEIKENEPVSFTINTVDKNLYVLLINGKVMKIPTSFKEEVSIITPDLDQSGESNDWPQKIFFSKNNSNIFYIMTWYNLYKFFNVGADVPIGNFEWSKTNVTTLTAAGGPVPDRLWDAAILDENNNYDSLFILDKRVAGWDAYSDNYRGLDKILRCNEPNGRIKLLENELFRSFDLNDILVDDQYFNSLTLNKSFKKLIFNMDILSSYLQSKFLLEYNEFDDLKSVGKTALTATPTFNKEYNMFTGPNEVVTPQVLNRCIDKIMDYQDYLLSVLQGKLVNEKYTKLELRYIAT